MPHSIVLHRIALLFGCMAAAIGIYYIVNLPTTFTVAVGPAGSEQAAFVNAMARTFSDGRLPVRLTPVVTGGSSESSAALDSRKVDLAVVRSDDPTSNEGLAIAVLHHRAVVLIGRADLGIEKLADLRGKRVVVLLGVTDSSRPLLERIMAHYGIGPADINLSEAPVVEAQAALAAGHAEALVMVSPPAGRRLRQLVTDLVAQNVPLTFIDLPSARAIASRFPDLQYMDVPAGIFGGIPPKPDEPLGSVAITYEIVASRALSDKSAALLTKSLLDIRPRLRRLDGATFAIEAPGLDEVRRYPPHPGAASQINDEQKTFLETYSDHIWLALFGFSLLGSSVAAFFSWLGVQAPHESSVRLHDLPALLARISSAADQADLDEIQDEFDRVVTSSVTDYVNGSLNDDDIDRAAWLTHVQSLIDRRRTALPP